VGTVGADVNALAAWSIETGTASTSIAILDTGVDTSHPEFEGKLLPGYDFISNNDDPNPTGNAHGTAAAGIAAAAGNNGQGIAGVAYGASIIPIRVCATNQCSTTAIASGISWAADQGASVISMSLGGGFTNIIANAVDYAYGLGSVVLASTGNGNTATPNYPAALPNVISVGALSPCNDRKSPSTCDGETWWGSSFGAGMDFLAPGTRIHTTDIVGSGGYSSGDYTATFNGTSAACPFAAGVAALLLSANPDLTPDEVRSIMQTTAVDLGPPGYDEQTGFGRIDAHAALVMATAGGIVTIENVGIGPLTVNAIQSDRPWLSVGEPGPLTLPAGGRFFLAVNVAWDQIVGTHEGTITLLSDDADNPIVSIDVTAISTSEPAEEVTVTRTVTGGPGWRMLAAPVQAVTVADLAAQNLVQGVPGYYEGAETNLFTGYTGTEWSPASGAGQALAPGHGFIWYMWDSSYDPGGESQSVALPFDLGATGFEPAADVEVPLNPGAQTFTLAGNPFAVPIDAGLLDGPVQDALHLWDPAVSGYTVVSQAAGDAIPEWEGFFVEHDGSAPGAPLAIPRLARLERGAAAPEARPWVLALTLHGSSPGGDVLADRAARLLFVDGAEHGWDRFDGSKLAPLASSFVQAAFVADVDGEDRLLAQDARPRDAEPFSVPLAVSASGATSPLALTWSGADDFPAGWTLHLEDTHTGTVIDLREAATYAFELAPAASRAADRQGAAPWRRARSRIPGRPARQRGPAPPRRRARRALSGARRRRAHRRRGPTASRDFAFEPVYPNPAREAATFRFSLPHAAPVTLEVYDVLGRRVALLVDDELAAGAHEARWRAAAAAPGVYVVRLRAGERVEAQRITVVR
jgi:hypothetical protein